jgi:hypothetical protein
MGYAGRRFSFVLFLLTASYWYFLSWNEKYGGPAG